MHVDAVNLHDPHARRVRVLDAARLVVLQAVDEPRSQRIGTEFVDARVAKAEGSQGRPLAPRVDLEAHEDEICKTPAPFIVCCKG